MGSGLCGLSVVIFLDLLGSAPVAQLDRASDNGSEG